MTQKTITVYLTDKGQVTELTCPARYRAAMLDAIQRDPGIEYNTYTTPPRLEMTARALPYWADVCADLCRVDALRDALAERGITIQGRDIRDAIEDREARAIIIGGRAYNPTDYARAALEYLTDIYDRTAGAGNTQEPPARDLFRAAHAGDAAGIAAAIMAGADPNATDEHSNTALMAAARSGKLDAVKQLVDLGADARKYNHYTGNGPIDVAAGRDVLDYLHALKDAAAPDDILIRLSRRLTPAAK